MKCDVTLLRIEKLYPWHGLLEDSDSCAFSLNQFLPELRKDLTCNVRHRGIHSQ